MTCPSEDMHHEVEWLKPSDRRILLEFKEYGSKKWMKPSTVKMNAGFSGKHVAWRCNEMASAGLLEKKEGERGAYRLTEKGVRFLADELSPEDLLDDEE